MELSSDRREHTRYRVDDAAFAFSDSRFPGRICDISMGGLAFAFIDQDAADSQMSEIDIMDTSNGFFLEKIPCSSITSKIMQNDTPFSVLRIARKSVRFGDLSEDQKDALEDYLMNCTLGTV